MIMRFLIPALLFTVLVLFFGTALNIDPTKLPSPLIGKTAPEFELETLADPARRVTSDELAGKPYLLNVWATWCVGCRAEHETLLSIAATGEIDLIGLNWKDDRAKALEWLSALGDPYRVTAFDPVGDTAIDWGVYGAPETFLVGADGTILYKHVGPLDTDTWQRAIRPLIDGS